LRLWLCLDHAWWGYETIDDESYLGHETGDGQYIDMNVMGYYDHDVHERHIRRLLGLAPLRRVTRPIRRR
jgi:hypothetical protein